jgi:hypothetical protein
MIKNQEMYAQRKISGLLARISLLTFVNGRGFTRLGIPHTEIPRVGIP